MIRGRPIHNDLIHPAAISQPMTYQPTYSNPILKKGVMTLKSVVFTGARASKYKTILIRASSVEAIAHAAQYVMEAHEKLYPMPAFPEQKSDSAMKRRRSVFGKGPQRRTVQSPPRSRYSDSEAAMQEFHLLAKERRCVRELEVYGQLSYAAAAKQALLVFIPIQATYASTVQPQFRNNDAELMEEPWYLQMNQIARIFDETEINAACQLSFITKSRQEFKFLCDSSSSYRHWIQLLDECFDECHPFEGLSNLYDLRGRRPSYGDSESSTYSSLPTHSPVRSSSAASGGSKVPSWNASMDSKNQEKKYSSDKWSMGKAATKSFVSPPPHPPPALASRSFSSPSGSLHVETHGNSFRFDSLERKSQVSDVPSTVVSRVKEERRKSMSGIKTSSVQVDSGSKRMSTGATSIKEFFVDSLKRIPSLKNRNSTGSRQDYDETHTSTKTKVVDTKLQDDQIWQPPAYLVPTPSLQPTAQTESIQQTTIHLQQHTTYGTENQQLYPQQPISTKKPVSKRGVRKRGSLLELWDDIPLGQVNLKSVDESLNANEEVSISKVSESLDANKVVLVSEVGESQVVNEVVSITEEASATGVSNASTKVESVQTVMEITKPKDLDIQLPESSHNSESQIAAVPIASVTSVAGLFRGIPSLEDLQKYEAELDSIASSLPTSPIRKAAIPIVPPPTPVATESKPVSSTSTEVVKSVTALNNDVSLEVVKSVTTITEETQRKDYPSIYVALPRSRGERRSSAFVSKLRETTEQILRDGKLTPISSSPPQLESVDMVKSVMEMSSVDTSANQTRAQETSMSSQANNTIAIQQSVIKTEKVFVEKPTVNLELSEYFDMTVDPIVQSDAAISTDCSTDYDDDIILPKTPCHSPVLSPTENKEIGKVSIPPQESQIADSFILDATNQSIVFEADISFGAASEYSMESASELISCISNKSKAKKRKSVTFDIDFAEEKVDILESTMKTSTATETVETTQLVTMTDVTEVPLVSAKKAVFTPRKSSLTHLINYLDDHPSSDDSIVVSSVGIIPLQPHSEIREDE